MPLQKIISKIKSNNNNEIPYYLEREFWGFMISFSLLPSIWITISALGINIYLMLQYLFAMVYGFLIIITFNLLNFSNLNIIFYALLYYIILGLFFYLTFKKKKVIIIFPIIIIIIIISSLGLWNGALFAMADNS
ncbi:hypothetical protein A2331_00080 [Candidatus Falkowbacteria bacterium RIFOXYB2_FULL_34_18]|uniref:Uncharacterized protein n=1 Tax=Candidatus Falkowbacteria bacterium RIFOXYD2_FULL_34_120 TaxID=1798007 RepID=A0A1F5TS24_9BACT|nr:MAG: hypothetical protein A2331_00080 [Candidatus Falkowbacteria bacterium RIFOXYB2_FULL_34_18]OGF29778.1 MAG: hypothetical protein A2500_01270 [Candidatus Falkowbacteria bacterium RIFOXYC12_FULL_34_55]OGF37493.1 MAG: hypothetical protein A2466_00640 [Candidatus Falkowbacteria bacterium RIFOXYC2_FULL_34_220]OGF39203.1 MAG: hypothetical protein A2515_01150 [Candidatus Falkowbacteria bacterium RIFOXYD12_FULL_34_57]OGF41770.1 MAG: hypothetical protein A2531_05810 [Candidatus Falkowbacteria bact